MAAPHSSSTAGGPPRYMTTIWPPRSATAGKQPETSSLDHTLSTMLLTVTTTISAAAIFTTTISTAAISAAAISAVAIYQSTMGQN